MTISDYSSLSLHVLYLTDKDLLNPLIASFASIGRHEDELKTETRLAFITYRPELPEHQRRLLLDELFNSGTDHCSRFLHCFELLTEKIFTWRDQDLLFRQEGLLPWVEFLGTRLSTLPLMAFKVAQAIAKGSSNFDTINRIFSGPIIPFAENSLLESLWAEGLVETHMHFNNSAHPALIWEQALRRPDQLIAQVAEKEQHNFFWKIHLPDITPELLIYYLRGAAEIRYWLVYFCLNDTTQLPELVTTLRKYFQQPSPIHNIVSPGLPIVRHPGELLPGGRAGSPLVCEGALWVNLFLLLRSQNTSLSKIVHLYLLLMSLMHKLILHQEDMKSFDLFELLADSPIRDKAETNLVKDRLIQLGRTGSLLGLEARVSGKEDADSFLQRKVQPIVEAYQHCRLPVDNPLIKYRLGLICHFIKKRDENRGFSVTGIYLTGRQAKLRISLLNQATAFIYCRDSYPQYGQFMVGIDGAGNELNTPPEVFAPVFRELKDYFSSKFDQFKPASTGDNIPPLRFTYHAGEEFYHLLSGLRAIDEAIEFLDLPSGSRLGHCLALGFDPKSWLDLTDEIRLPKLEWLDNLIWIHPQLNNHPDLQAVIEEEIRRESTYIYGRDFSTAQLHLAYKLRILGPTDEERLLSSQKLLHDKYVSGFYETAFRIYELYHFSEQVWKRGKEIIKVKTEPSIKDCWVKALRMLQAQLREKIDHRQLAIETCPISNLRISQLRRLKDHPIFDWNNSSANDGSSRLYVLLATDNPGLCQTSLPLEYAAVSQAAQDRDHRLSTRELLDWLSGINRDTKMFSFLPNLTPPAKEAALTPTPQCTRPILD